MKKFKKKFDYLENITSKESFFENSIRYCVKKKFKNKQIKLLLLGNKEQSVGNLSIKIILCKFLFSANKKELNLFNKYKPICEKNVQLNLKKNLLKIIQHTNKNELLAGFALKKVNGGFRVDLEGFLCFLPNSLSGRRSTFFDTTINKVCIFHGLRISLVFIKEQLFLNLVLSRRRKAFFLKGLFKKFIQKNVFNKGKILFNSKKNFKCLKKKYINVRLITQSLNNSESSLVSVKEVFTSIKNLDKK